MRGGSFVRSLIRCGPAVLAASVYANALRGSFHFDDGHAVVDNPWIRSIAHAARFFTDSTTFSVLPQNQGYRPILLLSYALTAELQGVEARAFIAVNLLVHLVCVVLVQGLTSRVMRLLGRDDERRLSLIASTLFAVHPLATECVNYVSARSESLCAMFGLAAMLAYFRGRERNALGWSVGAGLLMLAAFLVKPVAISVPFLIALIELAAKDRQRWPEVSRRLLWVVVPAALGMWLSAAMTPPFAIASASGFSRVDYARSELPAMLYYLALFVWPVSLNADHAFPSASSLAEPSVVLSLLVFSAVLFFLVRAFVLRRWLGGAVSLAWFFVCILPSSSVFPLAELVAERRCYLAMAGLCPLVSAAVFYGTGMLGGFSGRHAVRAGYVASGAVLAVLAVLTVGRNRVWENEQTLWKDVVAKSPESGRAHMNYGLTLMRQGLMDQAEVQFRDALRYAPNYSYAHINLGIWLLGQARVDEARWHFDRALVLGPNLMFAHHYRGIAAERMGEPAEVRVRHFRRAVALSPSHADAQARLAAALFDTQDFEGAERAARTAVSLRASYPERVLLARTLLRRGAVGEAEPILLALEREAAHSPVAARDLNAVREQLKGNGQTP